MFGGAAMFCVASWQPMHWSEVMKSCGPSGGGPATTWSQLSTGNFRGVAEGPGPYSCSQPGLGPELPEDEDDIAASVTGPSALRPCRSVPSCAAAIWGSHGGGEGAAGCAKPGAPGTGIVGWTIR